MIEKLLVFYTINKIKSKRIFPNLFISFIIHFFFYRIRHGYAHVANNLYMGWVQYAIGGSMEPSLKSQSNLFIAPATGKKEVIISSN